MALLLVVLIALAICGIAFLVIRRRKAQKRRPRARDLVPAHIQQRRIDNAVIRHLIRRERVQGVSPPGVGAAKAIRKAGRSR